MVGRKVDRWLTSPGVSCMMVCIGHRKEKRWQTKQKHYFVGLKARMRSWGSHSPLFFSEATNATK